MSRSRIPAKPIICYSVENLPGFDKVFYDRARDEMEIIDEVLVAPRDASTFNVPAGHLFRINSVEGPQVGDLNLWNAWAQLAVAGY